MKKLFRTITGMVTLNQLTECETHHTACVEVYKAIVNGAKAA